MARGLVGPVESASLVAASLVVALAGAAVVPCAAVELVVGGDATLALSLSAAGLIAAGVAGRRLGRVPDRPSTAALFRAIVATGVALVGAATVPYLAAGAFETFDDALLEAVAGVTTTAVSVVDRPEELARGIVLWRALTQWIGGAAVLVLAAAMLPYLGVGGVHRRGEATGRGALSGRLRRAGQRYLGVYAGLTVLGAAGYFAAGLGTFDAVAHALTTVSTGGFSTRAGSLGTFSDPEVEWVAAVLMAIAGLSLPLLLRAVRTGRTEGLFTSTEARVYAGVVVGGTMAAAVAIGGPRLDALRSGAVLVTSATSTTGFVTDAWFDVGPATAAALVMLSGVGGMWGAVAGGFTWLRVLAVFGFVRRELIRQLHPSVVRPVRVGGEIVDEEAAQRMIGTITLSLLLAGMAMVATAADGADLALAASSTVAAISNAGPVVGGTGPLEWLGDAGLVGRAALGTLMLLGRVEIYPVLGLAAAARGRIVSFGRSSRAVLRPGRLVRAR